jgi:hypothetical protein
MVDVTGVLELATGAAWWPSLRFPAWFNAVHTMCEAGTASSKSPDMLNQMSNTSY